MQEPPGLKPDWLTEIKSLSRKKPNISLYMTLSNILLQIGIKILDDSFFHSRGYIPLSMQWLKMNLNGLQMEVLYIFIMRMLILSWPCALFGSSFAIILSMSSSVILIEYNLSFVL